MASDDSSSSHPTEKKEEAAAAAAGGAGFDDLEDPRFQCCVCLELLYKPVVIACGHMSCFWCVHKAMHYARESHCAICRQPYTHFPSICQLLHHLLLKLEPVEYKKREMEVLEQERSVDTFSPQIIEFLNSKNNNGENGKDWGNKLEDGKTGPPGEASVDDSTMNEHSMKIKLDDVSCPICKELLYQPAVLNCGHVYCISCLPSVGDEALKCQVCGGLHPGDFPNVCLDLDHFLEEYFPAEYESRRKKLRLENSQCNPEGSSSSTSCKKGTFVQKTLDLSNVHIGVGCDSCGVYPIRGKRYKCKDCTEAIGFDLCGECYDSTSKLPGRFNQQHTPDHRMELDNSSLFDAFLRFQGIPAEGLQQLVQQMELIGAGGMVQIVADDEEMEDNHEDA
ncbi:E3 ubiquitin-protein ligase PRT1-like [Triticum dicoccoides]|uniref:E3 ubiquitin-protein ligase PRT1-like n=1 Tax=Triticum dicoccoides TaxID=85692 RepID=UPI00162CF1A6|nr:E3 ubiquitin-protein ligase PRT1-like [Triticum dicoccoides]